MNKRSKYDFEKRLLSIEEGCAYLGVGKNKAAQILKEINAQVKIGKCTRYDKKIIDRYIDSLTLHNNTHCESGMMVYNNDGETVIPLTAR